MNTFSISLSKSSIIENLVMKNQKLTLGLPMGVITAVFTACLGPLNFGFTLGYSSPATREMEQMGIVTKYQASWISSIVTVGAVFGGPLAGFVIEKAGRRSGLMFSCIPSALGWLFLVFSSAKFYVMVFSRFLSGISCGMAVVCCPVYIAEIATKNQRGFLGVMTQLFITLGIFFVYCIGALVQWKNLALLGCIIPLVNVLLLMLLNIPETPRWFLMHNRKAEAMRSLEILRGFAVDVEDECNDIQESIDPHEQFDWLEFKKYELLAPLKLSIFLMIIQQFSGINVIMFYMGSIFAGAGFENANGASIVIAVVQVVFTMGASVIMDKAGRRILLTVASFGMSLSCFLMAYYYSHKGSMEWLALSAVVLYVIFFSIGWGPIPVLVMSEIFPAKARSSASALAITTNWICAFIVTKEFNTLQELLGESGVFLLFGCICILGLGYVFKYMPETKEKSLEDIELHFLGRAIRSV